MEKLWQKKVLHDKSGKNISWLEATVEALKIIGHPASVKEIYEVMQKDVIIEVPKSAKTPIQTIYREIYNNSHDSKVGIENEHIFYFTGKRGVCGLVDNKLSGIVESMSDDAAGFPEGKAILEKHLHRERNSDLIKRAKKRFEKDHNNRL